MKTEQNNVALPAEVSQPSKIKRLSLPSRLMAPIVAIALFPALSPPPAKADVPKMVQQSAARHGVPAGLALRISKVESGHRCNAVGRAGERGPLQVLPSTARHMGYRNIGGASCATQIDAGMKYLRHCYKGAAGNHRRAAACFNAGPGALRWKRLPARVQQYVRKVGG
jgi:soluble lytic murein transglycosylase-like protein